MLETDRGAIAYLRTSQAIRDRSRQIFDLCLEEKLRHFSCDLTRLDPVADYVIATIQKHYPDLDIPCHSRWRHFDVGNVPRIAQLDKALAGMTAKAKARAKIDLAIVSVLLDAGAGSDWRYVEATSDQTFSRSEGLAVASFNLFCGGAFSSDPQQPYQVDAFGLQQLSQAQLEAGFQVSSSNPLVGMGGRLQLLHKLAETISSQPQKFGKAPPRLGNLVDYLERQYAQPLKATDLFQEVLISFSRIWSGRVEIAGENLGDVWFHPTLGELVPFHKLSGWLTYSLVEPLVEAGIEVINLDGLTGLAEYRNGGLFVDLGLLQPKQEGILGQAHAPDSEIIVEWRALTVVLLDRLAEKIREKLSLSTSELPLIRVLEGGTWSAGRKIAQELRPDGKPPILLDSDGTVF